ncbi:phosphoesterase [Clostridia bacterium]|nr:phosphoesterase [Clostridia bacterium]
MKILISMILLLLVLFFLYYCRWQKAELEKFQITSYALFDKRLTQEIRLAFLTDTHGYEYGVDNAYLLKAVTSCQPHVILVGGDCIVAKDESSFAKAETLLRGLVKIAPVYYCFGNHESRAADSENIEAVTVTKNKNGMALAKTDLPVAKNKSGMVIGNLKSHEAESQSTEVLSISIAFTKYLESVRNMGITILENQNATITIGADILALAGFDIPLTYYKKGKRIPMEDTVPEAFLGKADRNHVQILLAHNPEYGMQYAKWGSDLTLCGHNHGGLISFPIIGGLFSPQLTFFPKFNAGDYVVSLEGEKWKTGGGQKAGRRKSTVGQGLQGTNQSRHIIVSRGLGTHTFHIRIRNRAEVLFVRLSPEAKQ